MTDLQGGDMNRHRIWHGGLLLALAFFGLATRADAVITIRPTPIGEMIEDSTYIFAAKIDAVDPDKPEHGPDAG